MARRIRDAVTNRGRCYRDHAIFIRINALSRALEQAFVKYRVPFQIVRGLAFYERKENRDVLAYLRLLINPRDDLSFLRAIGEPARGIGKVSLEHLKAYAEPRELSLLAAAAEVAKIPFVKGKAAAGLRDFAQMMRELSPLVESPPDEVIRQVIDRSGYRMMLKDSKDAEDQERLANIEELITAARQFAAEDPSRTLGDFLENITLASDVDGWDERQDQVSIMTLHAAKGLEFPVVYMAAVEERILPHERSLLSNDSNELEEERRLAFVGMTRAEEELYLCHARLREFRGQTLYTVPSMFLNELPADAVEFIDLSASAGGTQRAMDEWRSGSEAATAGWTDAGITPRKGSQREKSSESDGQGYAVGMLVRHEKYGVGRVTEVSGYSTSRKIKVRFPSEGEKTFIADKARLAIVRKN
jgi:DNA helicase-2/ATP-dependent DNA helicase PcrA